MEIIAGIRGTIMRRYFLACSVNILLVSTMQSSDAAFYCQDDGNGNLKCVNNCQQPLQPNLEVKISTNPVNRDTIQKIIYKFNSPSHQGSDGLSTLSDQGDLSYPLTHTFDLTMSPNMCGTNPQFSQWVLLYNCVALSVSGSPNAVSCGDYLTYTAVGK